MLCLEEMGMKVQDVEAIHSSLNPWRVHNTEGGGGMTDGHGGQIIVPMVETFEKAGGTIIYNTTADKLLEAEDGTIVGLSGTTKDGTTVTVNAKGTIIATGGYAQNKEMMARYPYAEGYSTQVPKGNVGDGLVMAELIGVDKAALAETVSRYNELCAAGEDKDFGKPADKMIAVEGPQYAAIELKPAATVTYGGLVTDTTSHVLDTEGNTIPGLFAAGEVAFTGLFGEEYPCCGMAIGGGVYFGREAGREAAALK